MQPDTAKGVSGVSVANQSGKVALEASQGSLKLSCIVFEISSVVEWGDPGLVNWIGLDYFQSRLEMMNRFGRSCTRGRNDVAGSMEVRFKEGSFLSVNRFLYRFHQYALSTELEACTEGQSSPESELMNPLALGVSTFTPNANSIPSLYHVVKLPGSCG
jgi:hypothetical protein